MTKLHRIVPERAVALAGEEPKIGGLSRRLRCLGFAPVLLGGGGFGADAIPPSARLVVAAVRCCDHSATTAADAWARRDADNRHVARVRSVADLDPILVRLNLIGPLKEQEKPMIVPSTLTHTPTPPKPPAAPPTPPALPRASWPIGIPLWKPPMMAGTWARLVLDARPTLTKAEFTALAKEGGVPIDQKNTYTQARIVWRARHGLPPIGPLGRGKPANWMPPAADVPVPSPAEKAAPPPPPKVEPPKVEPPPPPKAVVLVPPPAMPSRVLGPVEREAAAVLVRWLHAHGVGSIMIERTGVVTVARPDSAPSIRVQYEGEPA